MAQEIERKFLVKNRVYKTLAEGIHYHQGYIPAGDDATIRIRMAGERGFITLKTRTVGISRQEFEYEIPLDDAEKMLHLLCAAPTIEKYRYCIPAGDGLKWEVDEFKGENDGLVIAEIELPTEGTPFEKPDWIGEEVSGDPRYYNSSLCQFPYSRWEK